MVKSVKPSQIIIITIKMVKPVKPPQLNNTVVMVKFVKPSQLFRWAASLY